MIIRLKPFVPEKECLACDGCCRYAERKSVWAPLFLFEEIIDLTQKNIVPSCIFVHSGAHLGEPCRVNLLEAGEGFVCPCFDLKENKCKIYPLRPFDCQLYPFLLTHRDTEVYLAVDKKCPYVKNSRRTKQMKEYVRYLDEFFATENFIQTIRENTQIVQNYPQDIELLAPLPELTRCVYGAPPAHPER